MIQLYGKESSDGDDKAVKVRIVYSRDRDDKTKAEPDWICKMVREINKDIIQLSTSSC